MIGQLEERMARIDVAVTRKRRTWHRSAQSASWEEEAMGFLVR